MRNTPPRKDRQAPLGREERRENALRPDPRLGYNRNALGVYFMSREAYALAESQFRRGIWLNPFEPAFKRHLAWCLYRQARYGEARDWALKAQAQQDHADSRTILDLLEERLKGEEE